MHKQERFIELVRFLASKSDEDVADLTFFLDCCLRMPEACIPDQPSLARFASGVYDHYFGRHGQLSLDEPRAARFIRRWKQMCFPTRSAAVAV